MDDPQADQRPANEHDDSPLGDEAERIDELASMLRGESRGETTKQEVVRMLADARAKQAAK